MKARPFHFISLVTATALALGSSVRAYTIGFENVPAVGTYFGSSEGGFTITSTGIDPWHAAPGNPGNALEPIQASAELQITGGTFTFSSFQYFNFSAITPGSYEVEGLLNGNSVYSASGSLAGGLWNTLASPDPASIIDTLRIEIVNFENSDEVFSRLDNIVVNPATASVPDLGGSLLLLATGMAGLLFAWGFNAHRTNFSVLPANRNRTPEVR